MASVVPEPPDWTRIEFTSNTDVYAAWRSDASSVAAGWRGGDGGEVWCLYGESVPRTWAWMIAMFGADALRDAVRLIPVERPVEKRGPRQATYRLTEEAEEQIQADIDRISRSDWDDAVLRRLDRLGLTPEKLRVMGEKDDFSSLEARKLWLAIDADGGWDSR